MAMITASITLSLLPTFVLCEGLIVGPSIVEIAQGFNDVFPHENFNRNVSVPMWDTSLLGGKDKYMVQEDLDAIANASFIAYDPEFYKVRFKLIITFEQILC